MKNGIQTTEFWVSLISVIGLVFGAVWSYIPAELVAKYATFIIAAYTIARAVVKLTPSKNDDAILDAIENKIMPIVNKSNISDDAKKN